jgi:hypothetical protein
MESCANCGTSIFATETRCIRCGHLTPDGQRAAAVNAQAQAAMPPPAFAPPPPRLHRSLGTRIAIGMTITVVLLAAFIGVTKLGEVPIPWTNRTTPLDIATLDVPDRCQSSPGFQEPGTQELAVDCWRTTSFEIAVIDMKITSPTADFGTMGRSILQATIGSTVTSPSDVTTPTGPAFDMYGTGHVAGKPVHFEARVFDIDGSMVIVAGAGFVDSQFREADYERAINSVRAVGTP